MVISETHRKVDLQPLGQARDQLCGRVGEEHTILLFQGSDTANPRCSGTDLWIPWSLMVSESDSLVTVERGYCLWRLSSLELFPLGKGSRLSIIRHVSPLLRAGEGLMLQSRKLAFSALR